MPGPYADLVDEANPTGAALIAQGQSAIRQLKRAIDERLVDVINNWPDAAGGPLSPKIPNLFITAALIALKTITTDQIADSTITDLQLADGATTGPKLADASVTEPKIADLSISSGKIKLLAIVNDLINSVDGAKLFDNSVPAAKLMGGIPLDMLATLIDVLHLADGAVTEPKLVDSAVTELKIADLAVTMNKLAVALKDKIAVPKYVDLAIPLTNLGSRATTNLADVAFPGVVARDLVGCALPAEYAALSDAGQGKLIMIAAVAKADAITPVIRNNNDGALDWPASTVRFWVTKSASAWGGSL